CSRASTALSTASSSTCGGRPEGHTAMTKAELESLIHGVAASMVYGLALMAYSADPARERAFIEAFRTSGMKFEGPPPDRTVVGLEADQLYARYSNPTDLQISKNNFVFTLRSTLVRFCYEAVQLYCDANGQKPKMKAEPWYPFTRVLRNVISHGEHSVLRAWPKEWKQQAQRRTSTST
ncbi:MAG: hypothetical protein ACRENE_16920, partial [Polyangiaceae bacterium]